MFAYLLRITPDNFEALLTFTFKTLFHLVSLWGVSMFLQRKNECKTVFGGEKISTGNGGANPRSSGGGVPTREKKLFSGSAFIIHIPNWQRLWRGTLDATLGVSLSLSLSLSFFPLAIEKKKKKRKKRVIFSSALLVGWWVGGNENQGENNTTITWFIFLAKFSMEKYSVSF